MSKIVTFPMLYNSYISLICTYFLHDIKALEDNKLYILILLKKLEN